MAFLSSEQVETFHKNGYLVLDEVFPYEVCDKLKQQALLLSKQLDIDVHPKTKFICGKETGSSQENIQYFMNSGDKIRYFFEEDAFNPKGELINPVEYSLNKLGHALHALDPEFKSFTHSAPIQEIARSMKHKAPKIVQSMYIFKQPKIGGKVNIHMDSTFLYTQPSDALLGFWIPIDHATLENGCLWFLPQSHLAHHEVTYRLSRQAEGTMSVETGYIGEPYLPPEEGWVPVEVKSGSLLLIHGRVLHKSAPNTSASSRHAYTFHIYDSAVSEYSELNWLQPTADLPFPSLYQ